MTYYSYIQLDSYGLITGTFESTKQASADQTELIAVDSYDPANCGRYYLNGEIGPAARDGYFWVWNPETEQFEEVQPENAE
jgi:hypothetical protein